MSYNTLLARATYDATHTYTQPRPAHLQRPLDIWRNLYTDVIHKDTKSTRISEQWGPWCYSCLFYQHIHTNKQTLKQINERAKTSVTPELRHVKSVSLHCCSKDTDTDRWIRQQLDGDNDSKITHAQKKIIREFPSHIFILFYIHVILHSEQEYDA